MSLSTLPAEVLNLAVSQLYYVDFVRLRSTNQYFDTLTSTNTIKFFIRELHRTMTEIVVSPYANLG
jgi:hypothetical protein